MCRIPLIRLFKLQIPQNTIILTIVFSCSIHCLPNPVIYLVCACVCVFACCYVYGSNSRSASLFNIIVVIIIWLHNVFVPASLSTPSHTSCRIVCSFLGFSHLLLGYTHISIAKLVFFFFPCSPTKSIAYNLQSAFCLAFPFTVVVVAVVILG